jgi:hypothetical protein
MIVPRQIISPIFIVGAPRSGTNIFYRTMARHPDLVWISNITKKVPASLLLTRILMRFRSDHRPSEGNNIWRNFIGDEEESVGRGDATPAARMYLHKIVGNHLQLFNKPRFLNKCPGNSVRIDFLKEIFPDAIFVHLIRDGRAAAYSIMRSRLEHAGSYSSVNPPGWHDLLKLPLVEACTLQWKMIVESVLQSAGKLPPAQYVEVRYEDFAARPAEIFRDVAAKCDLIWPEDLLQAVTAGINNRNFKWQAELGDEDKLTLNRLLGDFMKQLG